MAEKTDEKIEKYLFEFNEIFKFIDIEELESIAELLKIIKGRVFICGNGGSACTAQHIAEDMVLMANLESICLSDNVGCLTALANDISYEDVFSEQIKRFARPYDILIVISGSGNSKNILKAVDEAKKKGIFTIAIVGTKGGKLKKKKMNHTIHIKTDMQHFEDCSLIIGHLLTLCVME